MQKDLNHNPKSNKLEELIMLENECMNEMNEILLSDNKDSTSCKQCQNCEFDQILDLINKIYYEKLKYDDDIRMIKTCHRLLIKRKHLLDQQKQLLDQQAQQLDIRNEQLDEKSKLLDELIKATEIHKSSIITSEQIN